MDPRQPQHSQHPFARNTYPTPSGGHPSWSKSSNQAPFPPSSHAQNGPPPYAEHQRRPSDSTRYYAPPPPPPPPQSYAQDTPSMPAPSHSRHLSSSSIGHGTPVNRNMPPPSSPQQPQQSQHAFPPPLPRGQLPSLGTPIPSLTAGRDLPTLPPLHRPGSSMSISSMLGGPSPSTREPGYQQGQFPGPLPFTNATHPNTSYAGPFNTIPVAEAAGFARRIRTPEPTRSQELHGPRDGRANSAGSPPRGPSLLTSPEVSRYGTPQNYNQRPGQGPPVGPGEDRREQYPARVPNTSLPPRPNSQPTGFGGPPPPRPVDINRSEMPPYRHGYGDREPAYAYAERERQEKEAAMQREREREHRERELFQREREREREREPHTDRERQETEVALQREVMQRERDRREAFEDRSRAYAAERGRQELLEREQARVQERVLSRELEQRDRDNERREYLERENERREYLERENERAREREREMVERERASSLQAIPTPYPHQHQPQPQSHHPYRPYEPREQAQQPPWARPGYEHPPQDSRPQQQGQPPYEPPRTSQPGYPGPPSAHAPNDARYPPTSQPATTHHGPAPASQGYESSLNDRQRREMAQNQQTFTHGATGHNGPGLYQPHDSQKRKHEDEMKLVQQQQQQRERERSTYLGVGQQEINRRGRLSPLPQAVQGAQSQATGPVVEPGIKSEFGKLFPGIGSGAMSATTSTTSVNHTPFSNPRHSYRDDLEAINAGQDQNGENAQKGGNQNRGGGRRRKLKEEDGRDDDGSSTGRRTPNMRSKRPKIHHHPGGSSNSLQTLNQRRTDPENASSQANGTPFKHATGVISPASETRAQQGIVPHHHHVVRAPHHHHFAPQSHKPLTNLPPPGPTIPKPKNIIKSRAVLDSVAHYPRYHLGSTIYSSELKPSNPSANSAARVRPSRRGYSSTPTPLPRFEDRENCTFTVQVPHVYLSKESREEITARRPVWGTDIYTDDSDIIAACIHAGWLRGEWPEDVDISLLDLEVDVPGLPDIEPPINAKSSKTNKTVLLTKPPPRGPMLPPENKDLHVTIVVLPTLEKYSSVTRWGIKSREWGDHDGLSFMILEIKWVEAADAGAWARKKKGKVNGGNKFKLLVKEEEVRGEDEREKELFERVERGGGSEVVGRVGEVVVLEGVRDLRIEAEESFVRGDGAVSSGLKPVVGVGFKGVGMGSWWVGNHKNNDVEKENKEDKVEDEKEKSAEKEEAKPEQGSNADNGKAEEAADGISPATGTLMDVDEAEKEKVVVERDEGSKSQEAAAVVEVVEAVE